MPPKPLDYAELEKAANELVHDIHFITVNHRMARIRALAALTDIATRAFEQAARHEYVDVNLMRYVLAIGRPPVPLSDVLAALNAPATGTKETP